MSTKTMRPPSRRVPLPLGSNSKRKERDHAHASPRLITKLPKPDKQRSGPEPSVKSPNPVAALPTNNMLLAGYLAHEFLTKGTLMGRQMGRSPSPQEEESKGQKYDRYVELSLLLKTDGAHLGDIVNPTQLAHFLKL